MPQRLRVFIAAAIIWLAIIAIRTWLYWPEDILWDNGISSRQEIVVNAILLAFGPFIVSALLFWALRRPRVAS